MVFSMEKAGGKGVCFLFVCFALCCSFPPVKESMALVTLGDVDQDLQHLGWNFPWQCNCQLQPHLE